ncbi:MAG: hypothetical protein II937_13430 [Bacteroidales bacterium]|nr:hypothetical protein [Bacteroidales bacterium]
MKKILFSLMAFALCAMMFTSCKKDKDNDGDDDSNKVSNLSATLNDGKFSTSIAGFYSSKNSEQSGTTKLNQIFSSEEGSTTIAGTSNNKQLAITIKGTTSGSYDLNVSTNNAINNALINLLSGKTIQESIKDAVDIETEAMIIYRTVGEAEGGSTYYFSTEAHVDITIALIYSTGTFSATMMNKAGDKFTITDGSFKVFGKPVVESSSK